MAKGHSITIAPSSQHVVVGVGGEVVAESRRPVVLEETGSPTRYYLHRDDVRMELLRPIDKTSTCPFKGEASYWSLDLDGEIHDAIAWSYEHPIPGAEDITGLMCFYNERVDLVVD
jgi:uncharacterized protein (DUF427 family)